LYLNGWGVEKNYEKAFYYLTLAQNLNISKSWNSLGYMYYYGLHVPKNERRAYDYFKKGYLEKKDDNAGYDIMTLLLEGKGEITHDYKTAYSYANQIAAKGHNFGSYIFAMMNEYNIGSVINSCDITINFFQNVADKSITSKNNFNLANDYYLHKHYKSAFLLYLELAEEGIELGQLNSALLLKNYDIFIDKNYQKFMTVKLLKMAKKKGNILAKIMLGDFYFNGYGQLKQNYKKAKKLYESAYSSSGINKFYQAHILFNIGLMYNFGYDVDKNITIAENYFLSSIKLERYIRYPYLLVRIINLFDNLQFKTFIKNQIKNIFNFYFESKWKRIFYIISMLLYIAFCFSLQNQKN
jgi:SEL1 protein